MYRTTEQTNELGAKSERFEMILDTPLAAAEGTDNLPTPQVISVRLAQHRVLWSDKLENQVCL